MADEGIVSAPGTVRMERLLPGPIERVWSYLTDPAKRALWLAPGRMELRPGGRVDLRFQGDPAGRGEIPPPGFHSQQACGCGPDGALCGRVVACEPPHRLVFTWNEPGPDGSEVAFLLEDEGSAVRLRLTHRRLPDRETMIGVAGGWHARLDLLRDRMTGSAPAPFWPALERLEAAYATRIPRD